jgi:hypothetical protein
MKYLIGENPTKLNFILLAMSGLAGIVFTLFFLEAPLLIQLLSSIVVADIFAGAYSNITKSTNEFYHKQYMSNKLYAPVWFTLLHGIHIVALLLLTNYFSVIILFDFVLLIVLSLLRIDYKYHSLLIILSLLPGVIGFKNYGFFWSGVLVLLAVKSIAGYKLGLSRVSLRAEKK